MGRSSFNKRVMVALSSVLGNCVASFRINLLFYCVLCIYNELDMSTLLNSNLFDFRWMPCAEADGNNSCQND